MYIAKLTSIRGVACLIVLLGHCSDMFNAVPGFDDVVGRFGAGGLWPTIHQVLLVFFNGQAAVEVFFVMSGAVLFLQMSKIERTARRPIGEFYRRRVLRIYPGAIVATLFAYILFAYVSRSSALLSQPLSSLDYLGQTTGAADIAKNAVVVSNLIDPPQWSLKVELELSAAFPLIYLLAKRPLLFAAATAFAVALLFLSPLAHAPLRLAVLAFVLGCAIARFEGLGRSLGTLEAPVMLLALLTLMIPRRILEPMGVNAGFYVLPETVSAFLLVRAVFYKRLELRFLDWRPMVALGEWSYSFYVLHYPIMWASAAVLASVFGPAITAAHPISAGLVLALATSICTLPLASLSYRFVERPFMSLGRPALPEPSVP